MHTTNQKVKELNGVWKYRGGGQLDKKNYSDQYKNIRVPTFWSDKFEYRKKEFIREFKIKHDFNQAILSFHRLSYPCNIYLNNKKIHFHKGKETFLEVNVSDAINWEKKNILKVVFKNENRINLIMGEVTLRMGGTYLSCRTNDPGVEEAIKKPNWLSRSKIYELYVRAFTKGGKLEKVRERLPQLKKLNIDCLWLMPIFPIGQKNRKGDLGSPYAIEDFKAVNPKLGNKSELQKLIDKAHELGMKIILDIACNHSARDNNLTSNHPEWYKKDEEGNLSYPDGTNWYDIAEFDYSNKDLRDYMSKVLNYWIKELDIDGYRLDVAEAIPLDFWENALTSMKANNKEVLMLAEGDHPQLHSSAFHLSYSWNIRFALIEILNRGTPPKVFEEILREEKCHYPDKSLRMRFLENHDLQRSYKVFGPNKLKVAAVISYLIKGVPMIYNGQEIGAGITPSLFNKTTIAWDQKREPVLKFYKKLMQTIQKYGIQEFSREKFIDNSREDRIISFTRRKEQQLLIVIVNTSKKSTEVEIEIENGGQEEKLKNIFGQAKYIPVETGEPLEFQLPEYSFGAFVK